MNKNKFPILFVGAGPGDPELITVKGQRALMEADLVIYAGSLVPVKMLDWVRDDADIVNSASMNLPEIVEKMADGWKAEKKVVRLHTGDPSLYGAIFEQMIRLDKLSISYKVIPGVTAAFAAAASMGVEFTLPEITQTLILTRMAGRTPVPETENLELLAKHRSAMAIYLSISLINKVEKILCDCYGKEQLCAVAYRVGWPDEKIIYSPVCKLAETVKNAKIVRQAVVIVGKSLDICKGKKFFEHESKLYDVKFSHGFRK